MYNRQLVIMLMGMILLLGACDKKPALIEADGIQLMATTSIVGDIVSQVGGDYVSVEVLLPTGTDPHSFSPAPQDIAHLAEAKLVFINGAGLEEFLMPMIQSAGVELRLIDLSISIPLRSLEVSGSGDDHSVDPHTWMDPNNVIVWVEIVADSLVDLDPVHQEIYRENASYLRNELMTLDHWVREQVKLVPLDNRKLVTDHLVFGYFTDRYGFEQVAAIIPGFSTLAEPSAQELAKFEDVISQLGISALFVGWTTNQNLADRIADDTGVRVVPLYTHSLSEAGGEAEHYQDFIRYNVSAIVARLK